MLSLIPESDPRLYTICDPVTDVDLEVHPFIDDFHNLMILHRGVGIAAPQCGMNKRFFFIRNCNDQIQVFINPIIEGDVSDFPIDYEEGCLSKPGFKKVMRRSEVICVKYYNFLGKKREEIVRGFKAIVFQHEMDHLNGRVIWKET